jgi:phospholipase/lecithinase/hemolysin
MATTDREDLNLWRPAGVAIASVLAALLISACGSGGEDSPPSNAAAAQNAAQKAAQDAAQEAEWLEAAEQVAAPGGDAALAVEAIRAVPAAGVAGARRTRQVVVFGDSLSDVGTYQVGVIAQVGGGKFTTNPGPVWAETLGVLLRARVTPYRQGFAGVSQVLGGSGFAMGGSRITQQPGIGCNPDGTGACTAALTIPVEQQVADYLSANGNRFRNDQLVFLLAGANDIFFQLGVFQAKVTGGMPVEQAQAEALAAVQQAALELAGQVQRIKGKGATRVAVLNLPALSDTPFGNSPAAAPVRPLIAGMVQLFNGALAAGLQGTGATLLDFHAEFARVIDNPHAYLVREINVPACDAAKIEAITNGLEQSGSSLFCSRQTLLQNGAAMTYLFADSVHPTTLGHLIITRFVLIETWKQGLL